MRHNTKLTLASAISLAMLSACGGGGGGGSSAPANNAPNASVKASGTTLTTSTQQDLVANFGDDITLDASSSTDPDKDNISFEWKVLTKPETSQLKLDTSNSKIAVLKYKVDALGEYKLSLTVSDAKGAKTEKTITILANNTAPTLNTVENIVFQPELTQKEAKDISLGSSILFDASQSSDADGNKISFGWELTSKPTPSHSALQVNDKKASLSVDALGIYKVKVTGTDSKGATSEVIYTYTVNNRAPTTILLGNATPVVNDTGEKTLDASVGYNILLDGSGSKDADKDPLIYTWTLLGKPAKSTVSLADNTQSKLSIVPDVEGTYKVQLKVTDPVGASSTSTTLITVNNTRPTANIGSNATPIASATGPAVTVSLNTPLTVYGSNSTDPNGDALTYAWSIISLPKGSKLAINNPNAANLTFTGDVSGSYVLRLKVTDTHNASSEQDITINIGNNAPVANVNYPLLTTSVGSAVSLSGLGSFDADADPLSYQWTVVSKPNGSTLDLGAATTDKLTFTPDISGSYAIALTVNDGFNSNTKISNIRVLSPNNAKVTELPFTPDVKKYGTTFDRSQYSFNLDRFVSFDQASNSLKTVDPFTSATQTVSFGQGALNMVLSPDGKYAAVVLEDYSINLVDLESLKIINKSKFKNIYDSYFEKLILLNGGKAILFGSGVLTVDLVTAKIIPFNNNSNAGLLNNRNLSFSYNGILLDKKNTLVLQDAAISDHAYYFIKYDETSGEITGVKDNSWHELTALAGFSPSQSIMFGIDGTFYNTLNALEEGELSAPNTGFYLSILSLNASRTENSILTTIQTFNLNSVPLYQDTYYVYSGSNFKKRTDFKLPKIDGRQAYAIQAYGTNSGKHVVLAQTGTNAMVADGNEKKYYLMYF